MDRMGFLILILKCNQGLGIMEQYIIDSNTEKARNKEKKRGNNRKERNV